MLELPSLIEFLGLLLFWRIWWCLTSWFKRVVWFLCVKFDGFDVFDDFPLIFTECVWLLALLAWIPGWTYFLRDKTSWSAHHLRFDKSYSNWLYRYSRDTGDSIDCFLLKSVVYCFFPVFGWFWLFLVVFGCFCFLPFFLLVFTILMLSLLIQLHETRNINSCILTVFQVLLQKCLFSVFRELFSIWLTMFIFSFMSQL